MICSTSAVRHFENFVVFKSLSFTFSLDGSNKKIKGSKFSSLLFLLKEKEAKSSSEFDAEQSLVRSLR